MDNFIKTKLCKLLVATEEYITLTFPDVGAFETARKDKTIYLIDWAFNVILKEFGLNKESYKILLGIDKGLLEKFLTKKPLEIIFYGEDYEFVGLKGCYPGSLINYINANATYFDLFNVKESSISFSVKQFYFECKAFSDEVFAYTIGEELVTCGLTTASKSPMVKDFGNVVDIPIVEPKTFKFSQLSNINFTVYDLLKFKNKIKNFLDILIAINNSLGIQDISEVKGDYKSIIINLPVKYLYDNFRTFIPFETYEFLDYYLSDKYLSFRSKYTKTINIGVTQ